MFLIIAILIKSLVSSLPTFQYYSVLMLSILNIILWFTAGHPGLSVVDFRSFSVSGSYTYALLVVWITSICSGNNRQLLYGKDMSTTEYHIRTDFTLNIKGSALSARSVEHVQTNLLKCKIVQWFKARFGL